MRTVIKKDNDNNDIEVEYDEREYSKPNNYYIDINPTQDFLIEGNKPKGFDFKYSYHREVTKWRE